MITQTFQKESVASSLQASKLSLYANVLDPYLGCERNFPFFSPDIESASTRKFWYTPENKRT